MIKDVGKDENSCEFVASSTCLLISLTTTCGFQVRAAQDHAQGRGVDLDRQIRSAEIQRTLKATAFQSLRPDHQAIAIPHQDLAAIEAHD